MKLLFLSDNFPPEVNAPATRTYEHCKAWVNKGHQVTVLTCFPNFPVGKVYDGYTNKLYQVENIDGIKVIRLWTYISPNKGFIKRTLDYLSFALISFFAGVFKNFDLVIGTSPQFFTIISSLLISKIRFKKSIVEIRDIWPESISAVGAMSKNSYIFKFLLKIEKYIYKNTDGIVVVTDSFKNNLIQKGIDFEKIRVIKNGINLNSLQSNEDKSDQIINNSIKNLKDKTVVGYIGTHGMAHGLNFILKSIKKIKNTEIHFIFIGDGSERNSLMELANKLSLNNITFIKQIPKSDIPHYLDLIDIALVNLIKSNTFKEVIPSKIFENALYQNPILLGIEGESKKLIENYKIGISFEPENIDSFLSGLYEICQNKNNFDANDFRKFVRDFDRNKLSIDMLKFIEKINKS